jgi:hypothetical protein
MLRMRTIGKMIARLATVNLYAIQADHDLFALYGTDGDKLQDSGMITAPDGLPAWTVDQLLALLDLIAIFGRPTMYYIKLRNENSIRGGTVPVQAGRIPMDVAMDHAHGYSADVIEFRRVE